VKEGLLPTYPFLSPDWIDQAKKIYDAAGGAGIPGGAAMKMNQVVTDVPFGDGSIDAHIDSTGGTMQIELGHIDDAEVKITVPYTVAKSIFVEGNLQAAMQAFMGGQIKVEGDMTKLLAMQGASPDEATLAIQAQIKEITK
jgi:hypothetical protein